MEKLSKLYDEAEKLLGFDPTKASDWDITNGGFIIPILHRIIREVGVDNKIIVEEMFDDYMLNYQRLFDEIKNQEIYFDPEAELCRVFSEKYIQNE